MNRIWNSKLLRAARQTRLSTKILVFFIVASVGPLYLLLALDDAANTGILRKQQLENLSSQSVSLASQIQGQLVDWTRSADRLGRAPEVVRLAQGDGSGAADLAATLRGVPATDPSIRVAFVLGLNGQVGASSDPALIGSNDFAQAQFFKLAAQGNPSISDLSVDRGAPVPVLYVSTPVRDPLGHVLAVSALRADPQRIFDFLKPTLLGGSRQGLLLDEHGIVIGASDILKSQVLYHSLGPLNDTERQQMKAAGNFAGQDIPSLGMTDLSEAITAATQTGNTSSYFKPTGQTEVFGFAPVPQNSDSTQVQLPRWTVLVAQPESVFLAPEGQQTRNTATYTTVAALVFVLTIFIVARFFERTERQSLTDSLTGLPNRRYFHEILDRELTRSERTHRALSIINVDLDHFKLVNDEYGHSKGDEILRGFAKVLKDQVRSIDLPVRYGGEEFIVLLPDTDKEGAALVAEKIRRATDRLSIPRLGSMAGRKVTASAGVATFPLDATDGEQLLRCSDQAMYLAKNLGRNQVVAYGTDSGVSSLSKHPERVHLLVQNANKATIEALAAAIDARDTYTHGHSHRVADYARIIASEIEDEPVDMESLHLGALLHDVGKIGVSDVLLRKPG
ncbi:MAG TPA: diguanylate cyclase, partial [Candidatus Dormibacteraeota bacterium]|nr:diguanylate cyclase [Candidatus Dormibacteraeota bacterium]